MELKQLEIYANVYELKSFSKAAEKMFLSQPTISAHISALEKELQTRLIYRSTKEFVPSKAGIAFYEYAREMLALRDRAVFSLKAMDDHAVGNVHILASSVPAHYILPDMLSRFHRLYPGVVFRVEQADSADVVRGIAEHRGEIGFVGAKIENPKCVYREFLSEKLLIIAPRDRGFEGAHANPEDVASLLRNEYFVMRNSGSGTRLEYEDCLANFGASASDLKISAYFDNTQSIIHAVAGGLGLSIVSELAARHYIRQGMVVPLYSDALPTRHFYIVLNKNRTISAQVAAFISEINLSTVNCQLSTV